MPGIRVEKIPKEIQDKQLKIHFSKPVHGGSDVKHVYYPLTNNDAVIIFKSQTEVESVLKEKHTLLGQEIELRRLPEHEIFLSLEGRLNTECSVLLQASQQIRDEMEYVRGIKVHQHDDQTYSLQGNWYQMEWAWRWIDTFMQQQEIIQNSMNNPQLENMEIEEYTEEPPPSRRSTSPRHSVSSRHSASPTHRSNSPSDILAKLALADSLRSPETKSLSTTLGHDGSFRSATGGRQNSPRVDTGARLGLTEGSYPGNIGGPDSSMHHLKRNIHQQYDGRQYTSLVDYPRDRRDMYSPDLTQSRRSSSDDDLELTGQPFKVPFESVHSTLRMENRERRANENSVFEDFSGLRSMQRQQEALQDHREVQEAWTRTGQSQGVGQHSRVSPQSSLDRYDEETKPSAKERYKGEASQSSIKRNTEEPTGSPLVVFDEETGLKYPASNMFEDDGVRKSASYSHVSPRIVSHLPDRYSEDQLSYQFEIGDLSVIVYYGDITKEETETIVNAANEDLNHTGGVAGALLASRGYEMQRESNSYIDQYGRLPVTQVTHTSGGGGIKAAHILHAAGPIWFDHKAEKCSGKIAETFLNCFRYTNKKLWSKSIALPAISTGVYGAPLDVCVRGFLYALLVFVNSTQRDNLRLHEVRLVNNDAEATVTSIVLVQTLLEEGIQKLTTDALELLQKQEQKEGSLNIPRGRPERSGSFSKTFSVTKEPITRSSEKSSPGTSSAAKRRSSSLSRVADKTKSDHSRSREADERSRSGLASERGRERGRTGSFSGGRPVSARDNTKVMDSSSYMSHRALAKTSKTAPQIKQGMTDINKLTSFHIKSGTNSPASKTSSTTGRLKSSTTQKMSATMSARSGPIDPRRSYEGTDEEEAFGMQSLPADFAYGREKSYREKFLQLAQPESRRKKTVEICAICLEVSKNSKELPKCKHSFCEPCIRRHFKTKPTCPVCGMVYGEITGNQPKNGTMTHVVKRDISLPGHEREDGLIMITYSFPGGIQDKSHPNPGRTYKGLTRKAYLPNSLEGREVLRMLKKAFDLRLVFTIGQSRTTGALGVLTWNDLHHKTSMSGGPTKYGYPDSGYLKRIKEELADKGITTDM